MTVILITLLTVAAGLLTWLQVTRKLQFPLLFDAGLTIAILAIAGMASTVSDGVPERVWWMLTVGIAVMLLAYLRHIFQLRRRQRARAWRQS